LKKIAIYGAGGFGREVLSLIEHINLQHEEWQFMGFFDDQPMDSPSYLGGIDVLNSWPESLSLVIATGDSQTRHAMHARITKKDIHYPVLIHPSVIFGRKTAVQIGEGSIICAGTIITLEVEIGSFSIVNLNSTIGHNSRLGAFSSLMPAVNIAGDVRLGEGVYVGSGANILNGITIGEQSKIGSGAVVTKNLPTHCTAVGVPAKVVKQGGS
jgi:sugar O-acyltransferase (sialic acid O-acetyltransferase NeuD family)